MKDHRLKESREYMEEMLVDDHLLTRMKGNIQQQIHGKKHGWLTKMRYAFVGGLASGITLMFVFFYVDGLPNHYSFNMNEDVKTIEDKDNGNKLLTDENSNKKNEPVSDVQTYQSPYKKIDKKLSKVGITFEMSSREHDWTTIQGIYKIEDLKQQTQTKINFAFSNGPIYNGYIKMETKDHGDTFYTVSYGLDSKEKADYFYKTSFFVEPLTIGLILNENFHSWYVIGEEKLIGEHTTVIEGQLDTKYFDYARNIPDSINHKDYGNGTFKAWVHSATGMLFKYQIYNDQNEIIQMGGLENIYFNLPVENQTMDEVSKYVENNIMIKKFLPEINDKTPRDLKFISISYSEKGDYFESSILYDKDDTIFLVAGNEKNEQLREKYQQIKENGESITILDGIDAYYLYEIRPTETNYKEKFIKSFIWKNNNIIYELLPGTFGDTYLDNYMAKFNSIFD